MKIADFFIALGFKVDGGETLPKTEEGIKKLEVSSLKLLAGVTALNAAFYSMIAMGVEAGIALQRFALTTGLSAEELQRWQLTAVRGNVAASKMAEAIGTIQKAQASIAFGNAEAAAPWMLLGIDPRQDPFKVLEQLRQQVLKLDPAIARQKLSEMGFGEDMLFLMRQPNFGRGNLDRRLVVSDDETKKLAGLGAAWRELLFTLGQVGARFSAQFAEPLAAVLKELARGLTLVGRFVDWLEKGSLGAEIFMHAMIGILVVMGGLAVAIGLLLAGPFGEFTAIVALAAIGIAALILIVQDLWTAMTGGKSAFGIKDDIVALIALFGPFGESIAAVAGAWALLVKNMDAAKNGLGWAVDIIGAGSGNAGALAGRIGAMQAGSSSAEQTNHINVTVPAASNPQQTGRDVGLATARQISDAFGQMPLPSR